MKKQQKNYTKRLFISLLSSGLLCSCVKTKTDLGTNFTRVTKVFTGALVTLGGLGSYVGTQNSTERRFIPAMSNANAFATNLTSPVTTGPAIQKIQKISLYEALELDKIRPRNRCYIGDCIACAEESTSDLKVAARKCVARIILDPSCDGEYLFKYLADKIGVDELLSTKVLRPPLPTLFERLMYQGTIPILKAAAERTDLDKLASKIGSKHIMLTIIQAKKEKRMEYISLMPNYFKKNINEPVYDTIIGESGTPLEMAVEYRMDMETITLLINSGAKVTKELLDRVSMHLEIHGTQFYIPGLLEVLKKTYDAQDNKDTGNKK